MITQQPFWFSKILEIEGMRRPGDVSYLIIESPVARTDRASFWSKEGFVLAPVRPVLPTHPRMVYGS